MTPEEIVERVKSALGDDVRKAEVVRGDAVLHAAPEVLHAVARFLKEEPDLNFHYLSDLIGVDYLDQDRDPRFEAVYELHSFDHNHSVRIRVGLPEENPALPTVTDLWAGAIFPERELYDMFGFRIEGLEGIQRLIMPETWEGHPLRRDYPLTTEDVAFSYNRDYKKGLVKSKSLPEE